MRAAPYRSALVAVVLTLAACAGVVGAGGGEPPAVGGRPFVSTSTTGRDLVEGSRVRLIFQADRISVRAGCNTLMGAAEWADGVLRLTGPLGSTMMACADALMDQDAWLSTFLESEPTITLEGTTLTLGDEAESITFDEQ